MAKLRISNLTRGTLVASRADFAGTGAKARTGLLKHSGLAPGEGLWIAPCEAVHTFGMRFPIDVIFLNARKKVVQARPNLARWRIAFSVRASSVLELPAGQLAETGTQCGDELQFEKFEDSEEKGA
ncbi:MAG TPA: DUF192 domain-containing protein [Bryobacteraceae bacterium]|jgi:hypothetical protein